MNANRCVTQFDQYRPSGRLVRGKRIALGVDLDGCVDMGMEKHLLAFGTASIIHYNLQPIQNVAMKAWMYVNYFSMDRGVSRFVTLYKWADIVNSSNAARALNLKAPDFRFLRKWTAVTPALSPEALQNFLENEDPETLLDSDEDPNARPEEVVEELEGVLQWSNKVNSRVPEAVENMQAFPNAVQTMLEAHRLGVDIAIVSGTPQSHIEAQTQKYGVSECLQALWGQQAGRKSHALVTMMVGPTPLEQIERAVEEKKPLLDSKAPQYDFLAMIGDAPKDNTEREKANFALSGNAHEPIRMRLVPVEGENDAWAQIRAEIQGAANGQLPPKDKEEERIQQALSKLNVQWRESPVYAFGEND